MSIFFMYVLVMLDSFIKFFGITTICLFIIAFIATAAAIFENFQKYKKLSIGFLTAFFISLFFTFAIPTTKEAAVIYLVPTMANNEKLQSIGKNSLDILEKYTQDWLQDLTKKETKRNEKSSI